MPEEYLDIVDENDNPTGEKELRSVAHTKGLRHRTVHIYFYRAQNNNIELLVHLRSKNKSSQPNKWDTRFGGHVEAGQTINSAALRETQEETGIKIRISDLIKGLKRNYESGTNKEISQTYYYNFRDNLEKLSFDDGEVQRVKWMNFDEIEKSMRNNSQEWAASITGLMLIRKDLASKI
jgi:isopentenyldiphosphate isomerase